MERSSKSAAVQLESRARPWEHSHTFGQEQLRAGEKRTLLIVAITVVVMAIETAAGLMFGSMALLADGLHMGSHALALSINAAAYIYARKRCADETFCFGTGKINALGAFAGAMILSCFAAAMGIESVSRLWSPVEISPNYAIVVAVAGLIINLICMLILGSGENESDLNRRSAYLHLLSDTATSVLAIAALVAAKWLGFAALDPLMGILGCLLILHWSRGLLRSSSAVLLDKQAGVEQCAGVRTLIAKEENTEIVDLHCWAIGPDVYSLALTIAAGHPKPASYYRTLLGRIHGLGHITVEIHQWPASRALQELRAQSQLHKLSCPWPGGALAQPLKTARP